VRDVEESTPVFGRKRGGEWALHEMTFAIRDVPVVVGRHVINRPLEDGSLERHDIPDRKRLETET
jgi:hypothetical protein